MSCEPAVRLTGVSKRFRVRTGDAGLRQLVGRHPPTWREALSDVSFEVAPGAATALLGTNGAGKTTLLRLVAGISRPTTGTIVTTGQVGALIEVWNGVHLELTGRENIKLLSRILGLSRRQVAERFDAIVEFSELAHALDQQVKYYSSGMLLRLGFAIAAQVEPEVLLVDEALSVGDARFQRRCVARMRDLMAGGTTLLYVSHDLHSVEALCDHGVLLDQGRVLATGSAREVLARYLDHTSDPRLVVGRLDQGSNAVRLEGVTLFDHAGRPVTTLRSGAGAQVELRFSGPPAGLISPHVAVGISAGGPSALAVLSMAEHGGAPERVGERWTCRLHLGELPLRTGSYELWLGVLGDDALSDLFEWAHVLTFKVEASAGAGPRALSEEGPLLLDHRFEVEPDDRPFGPASGAPVEATEAVGDPAP